MRAGARVVAAIGLVAGLLGAAVVAAVTAGAAVDPGPSYYSADDTADAYGRSGVTWTGTPSYGAGHTGAAGDRAFVVGPGGVLSLNDPDVGNFGTADFTLNLHVQLDPAVDDRVQILSKRAGCAFGSFLDLRAGTQFGGVHFEIQDLLNPWFNVVNPANVFDGAWHQITARRTGTLVSLTVDGVTTSATSNGVVNIDNSEPMRFGDGGCVTGSGQVGDTTSRASGRLDAISFGPGSEIVGPPAPPPTDPPPPPTTSPPPPPTTAPPPPTTRPSLSPPSPAPPSVGPPASPSTPAGTPANRPSFAPGAAGTAGTSGSSRPPGLTTPVAATTTTTPTTPTTTPRSPGPPSDESAAAQGRAGRPAARSGSVRGQAVPGLALDAGAAFVASLPAPDQVRTSLTVIVQNALLAILLLTLLALPIGIVNDTAKANAPRFAALAARAPRVRRLVVVPWYERWRFTIGLAVAAVVGAVIYGFVQPAFGLDLSSLALVLGFAVAFLVVSATKELSTFAFLRRTYDIRGFLKLFPAFALVGLACVTVSRAIGLQPGLILGSLAALGTRVDLDRERQGRAAAVGAGALAGLCLVAWTVRSAVMPDGPPDGFVATVVSVALTAMAVAGAEHLAFGLLPLSFLDGAPLYAWSKTVWAGFSALGAFVFVHVLLQRDAGPFADRVTHLLVLLLVYLGGAAAFWAWFRFRPRPVDADPTTDR